MTQTIIVNDKIELTEIRETDKPQFVQYLNNKEHYENTLMIPTPYHESDAAFFVNLCREAEKQHGHVVNFAIRTVRQDSFGEGVLIGGIGLMTNEKPLAKHKAEIGYWVGKPFWGQGIMTEVVRVFSDYWLNNSDYVRLEATVFASNMASKRVLEKAGFTVEGFCKKYWVKPLDGQPKDVFLLSKINEKI